MRWLWDGKAGGPAAINSPPNNGEKSPAKPPRLDGRENDQVMKGPVSPNG